MVSQPKQGREETCPRCGCKLLWNGHSMSCLSCSYLSRTVNSEKKIIVPGRDTDPQKSK